MSNTLALCPNCGGTAEKWDDFGGWICCTTLGCAMAGPSNDPEGVKWNRIANAVQEAEDWRQRANAAESILDADIDSRWPRFGQWGRSNRVKK